MTDDSSVTVLKMEDSWLAMPSDTKWQQHSLSLSWRVAEAAQWFYKCHKVVPMFLMQYKACFQETLLGFGGLSVQGRRALTAILSKLVRDWIPMGSPWIGFFLVEICPTITWFKDIKCKVISLNFTKKCKICFCCSSWNAEQWVQWPVLTLIKEWNLFLTIGLRVFL